MIAIVGATGALGSEVARRLMANGHRVAAITRSPDKAGALAALGAEVRIADLTDHASLADAIRGATAVFAAAHSILGSGRYASKRVDGDGHRALIDAATAARVEHFVYTSLLGARPSHPALFWRTKFEIEAYLKASGLSYTILRPSAFMETHAHELLGKAVMQGRTAIIVGRGDRPVNFVAVRDVATFAVLALTMPDARGMTIEIGGPDNPTRNQVAELYARVSGQPLRVLHVPAGVLGVLGQVIGLVHPGIGGIMHAGALFESIDQSFDPTETLRRFPTTLTPLETFVRHQVGAVTPRSA